MRETTYQRNLIKRIEKLLPGCYVFKNDPLENQGIPDILILFNDKWGMLEVKVSSRASEQPNQSYYVDKFNELSFASFICPETEEEVLNALQSAFRTRRKARLSQS